MLFLAVLKHVYIEHDLCIMRGLCKNITHIEIIIPARAGQPCFSKIWLYSSLLTTFSVHYKACAD